jgi:hypothetical protein
MQFEKMLCMVVLIKKLGKILLVSLGKVTIITKSKFSKNV